MTDVDSLFDDLTRFNFGRKDPSIVQRVFQRSCLDLVSGRLVAHVDEETMTGALLGAFATNAVWSERLIKGASGGFSWVRYRKSPGAFDSETRTGADFALLIRNGRNDNRMAVFQAKRPASQVPRVLNVSRLSPAVDGRGPEPQFERLRRYGHEVLSAIGRHGNADDMSRFYWMHYLTYTRVGMPTYSLDQLEDIRVVYEEHRKGNDENPPSMPLKPLNAMELVFLLTAGALPAQDEAEGWLDLNDVEANAATAGLARNIPVVDVAAWEAPELLTVEEIKANNLYRERLTPRKQARMVIADRWADAHVETQKAKYGAGGKWKRPGSKA